MFISAGPGTKGFEVLSPDKNTIFARVLFGTVSDVRTLLIF